MLQIIIVVISLIISIDCNAQDLNSIFNQYTVIENEGTQFTILGVEYGGSYYWGHWELQDDLSFKLVDGNIIDEKDFFNADKAGKIAKNSIDIQKDEVDQLNFDFDTTDCLSYSKYEENGFTTYFCKGKNFVKVLGKTDNSITYIYDNFIFPLFLANNSSYTTPIKVTKISDGDISYYNMYFNLSVSKTENGWIESYNVIIPFANYILTEVREFDSDYTLISQRILQGQGEDVGQQ